MLEGSPAQRRALYRACFALASVIPPGLGRVLAYILGYLGWALDARGRKVVERNLAHFVPAWSDAHRRAVRRAFIDFCIVTYESFAMPTLPAAMFQPPNLEFIDPWNCYARKPLPGPTVMLSVHCNCELILAAAYHLKLNDGIEAIALTHGDDLDALWDRMRAAVKCRTLLLDKGGPLASLRALKAGKTLGVVGERDYSGSGLPVMFAGEMMSMPIGSAAMAVQTGAVVIPHLLARRGWSRWTLIVGRPLRPDPDAPKQAQVTAMTRAIGHVFARFIATVPAQWTAFHDHWPALPQRDARASRPA
ncbi:MAG TPA: hypothetical protein VEL07_01120 [Planctomycetota bacterium]|nr:hypothetical protein [Planctomycetota bacterium]